MQSHIFLCSHHDVISKENIVQGGDSLQMPRRKEEGKVPLNMDAMSKCMCGTCPVQAQSTCARPKIEMAKETHHGSHAMNPEMMKTMGQDPMPKPSEIAEMYCSIGVAPCKDLDSSKMCICRQCQVYKDFSLMEGRPVEHFCFNDKAV